MKALLFGSIGTLIDSSALQLACFNAAFKEVGLDWHWKHSEYQAMLAQPGGKQRLRRFADGNGGQELTDDMVDRIHRLKTEGFSDSIKAGHATLRPGVSRVIEEARAGHLRVGLITTTERQTINAIIESSHHLLNNSTFDVVVDRTMVGETKPSSEAYQLALEQLGMSADNCIAIEDTPACLASAVSAGIICIATPNAYHLGADFSDAAAVVSCLGDVAQPAKQLAGRPILTQGLVTLKKLARLAQPTTAQAEASA